MYKDNNVQCKYNRNHIKILQQMLMYSKNLHFYVSYYFNNNKFHDHHETIQFLYK